MRPDSIRADGVDCNNDDLVWNAEQNDLDATVSKLVLEPNLASLLSNGESLEAKFLINDAMKSPFLSALRKRKCE